MDQSAIQLLRQLRPDYADASDEQIEQAVAYTTENHYKEGEFLKGLRRATGSTAGGIQAFAGQLAEPVAPEWGREQIESGLRTAQQAQMENPAAVQNFTDIDSVGGALDWAAGSMGEAVPTIATAAVGGGLGSLGVAYARKRMLKEALDKALESGAARFAGSTVGLLPQEAGEAAMSLNADEKALANTTPGERIALMMGKGGVNAALESVVPNLMFGKFAKPTVTASGKILPQAAKTVGQAVSGEFATEAAQQFTGDVTQHIANSEHDWLDPEGLLNAGAAGAVGGGGMGAVGAGLSTAGHVLGKRKDSSPVGDTLFEAGRAKARREFAAMDEVNNMEAERQGITPEELILNRAGLSGENVTAADVMADDQERTAAAQSLATKIVNDVASPEDLRKSAAEFIVNSQTDPMAHVAFTDALQAHKDKGGAMQAVNDLLDAFGINLPPERRKKNNAQSPQGEETQPHSAREVAQRTAQLWLDKYGAMTDAFSKLDLNDTTVVGAVEGAFNWVKQGMPNVEEVAPRFVRAFGKDAAKHLQTIYDYSVAEGLVERSSQVKAGETITKVQQLVARGVGRFDLLGNLVMPSQQDNLTTRDLKTIDRALNKFAEDRSLTAKEVKAFRERMAEYFGGNVDEVLDLYDREVKEDLYESKGETERDEDGDMVEEDFDNGLSEIESGITYHGNGFDTVQDANVNKLKAKLAELGDSGFEVGAWEKLKRELGEWSEALRAQEDELIKKYGDHPSIKSQGSRRSKLRAIDKRIRFAAEWVKSEGDRTEIDKRGLKDVEDKTKQGKKTDPKYQTVSNGRLVMERMVDDESTPTGTDPETGELTFAKKPEEFIVKLSKLVERMRKARKSGDLTDMSDIDLANTWNQLMTGLSSLMNRGEFTGRLGYRSEVNGPVTWLKSGLPSDKQIAEQAQGKKVKLKRKVGETGEVVTVEVDAQSTVKDLKNEIDALEALKLCMGA